MSIRQKFIGNLLVGVLNSYLILCGHSGEFVVRGLGKMSIFLPNGSTSFVHEIGYSQASDK